jgi:uncharacterized membrane protein YgcG
MDNDWLLAVAIFLSLAVLFIIVLNLLPRRRTRGSSADSSDSGGTFVVSDGDSGGDGGSGGD